MIMSDRMRFFWLLASSWVYYCYSSSSSSMDLERYSSQRMEDVIVVMMLDGSMAGLHWKDGRVLWKQQRKDTSNNQQFYAPLIRSTSSTEDSSSSSLSAIPSMDGMVYLTPQRGATAAAAVSALVAKAPFVDAHGRFYVGSRTATAAAMDIRTGNIQQLITTTPHHQQQQEQQQQQDGNNDLVWLGRVDYSVSVYHTRTGAMDVQFGTSQLLTIDDMVYFHDHHKNKPKSSQQQQQQQQQQQEYTAQISPTAVTGGDVHFNIVHQNQDNNQRTTLWKTKLESPVAFAVWVSPLDQSSTPLPIQITDDTTTTTDDEDSPQLSYFLEESSQSHSLFELPDTTESDNLPPWLPIPNENDENDENHSSLHSKDEEKQVSTTTTATSPQQPSSLQGMLESTSKEPGAHLIQLLAASGYYQDVEDFYDAVWEDIEKNKQKNRKQTTIFFQIVSSWIPPVVALVFVLSFEWGRRERARVDKLLRQQQQQPQPSNKKTLSPSQSSLSNITNSNSPAQEDVSTVDDRDALLTSNNEIEDTLSVNKNITSSSATNTMDNNVSSNPINDEAHRVETTIDSDQSIVYSNNNSSNSGLIQVSEEVLGYGGHGTVVFKGKLEGRNVAVKRMLKTYHASADREISLLIESDGHSNVVRYFLKEVRGDFVYLALELCNFSLQELIISLSTTNHTKAVALATKKALLDIASGVQHLHSLRIVHRDLKPQNILLSLNKLKRNKKIVPTKLQNETNNDDEKTQVEEDATFILKAFERMEYTPKISDMGLGKQLTAPHSSFGFQNNHTASSSSFMGLGNNQYSEAASTIGGAGPGSVGWQAPEVMAQRWCPESAAARINNNNSNGSTLENNNMSATLMEASPTIMDNMAAAMRTSRSVDIFSLGCIFYCTLLPGLHPFGEWYEREANIMKNQPSNFALLEEISPDAADLISNMIHRDPKLRPNANQVCNHAYFWTDEKRMNFICDVSDRLEADNLILSTMNNPPNIVTTVTRTNTTSNGEPDDPTASSTDNKKNDANVVLFDEMLVETNAIKVIGASWDKCLDPNLLTNVSKFRTYDPTSVRACLRLIRNKVNHFDELPASVKQSIGTSPVHFFQYIETKYPKLVSHCYKSCQQALSSNDPLNIKYGISPTQSLQSAKEKINNLPGEPKQSTLISSNVNSPISSDNNNINDTGDSNQIKREEIENENKVDSIDSHQTIQPTNNDHSSQSCEEIVAPDTVTHSAAVTNDVPSLIDQGDDEKNDSSDDVVNISTIEGIEPTSTVVAAAEGLIIWEGSSAAKKFGCRGWMRSVDEWTRRTDISIRQRNANLVRCAQDAKFRTRLCNHWDTSMGTFCPKQKQNKCIFAHGPIELRVKRDKRNRWGKLVDKNGNNSNPLHSGGEDTYGPARTIETKRQAAGKWNPNDQSQPQQRQSKHKKSNASSGSKKKK